jgi:hypothetical protein
MESGYAFAGSNAHLATKITSVKEVFNELVSDLQDAIQKAKLKLTPDS